MACLLLMLVQGSPQISMLPLMSPLPSTSWLVLGFCGGLILEPRLVASTFHSLMHDLSGCCDSHFNHLHHYLLRAALTCRISFVHVWSYWACGYVELYAAVCLKLDLFSTANPKSEIPLQHICWNKIKEHYQQKQWLYATTRFSIKKVTVVDLTRYTGPGWVCHFIYRCQWCRLELEDLIEFWSCGLKIRQGFRL